MNKISELPKMRKPMLDIVSELSDDIKVPIWIDHNQTARDAYTLGYCQALHDALKRLKNLELREDTDQDVPVSEPGLT